MPSVPRRPLPVRSGFLVLSVLLVSLVHGEGFEEPSETASHRSKTRLSSHPVVLVVSYDGFRYDYFSMAATPHMDAFRAQGVRTAYMRNEFPTKSYPNHQSAVTGLHPESHGVVENSFFDPDLGRLLYGPDEAFWDFRDDVVPLWVLNEWAGHGRVSGSVMWPGAYNGYGPNKTRPTHNIQRDSTVSFEARVDMALSFLTNDTEPANLVFLYFEEPDQTGHAFGPSSGQVEKMVERMDDVTGYLVSRLKGLGILDALNVILLSDHGFEDVRQNHIINFTSFVDPALYTVYGGSPIHLIQPQPGQLQNVYSGFEAASRKANFSVYLKETINGSRPDWFYQNNPRISPIVLVADLGYAFEDFYRVMMNKDELLNLTHTPDRVYGSHGYDNQLKPMHAFFMAHGPAFRSGVEVEPLHNIDLFPLVCYLVGIPTPPNNGTLPRRLLLKPVLTESLGSPGGWTAAASGGVIGGLVLLAGIISMALMVSRRRNRRRGPLLDTCEGHDTYGSAAATLI